MGLNLVETDLEYEVTRVKSPLLGRDLNPMGRGDGMYYTGGNVAIWNLYPFLTLRYTNGTGNSINNHPNGPAPITPIDPSEPTAGGTCEWELIRQEPPYCCPARCNHCIAWTFGPACCPCAYCPGGVPVGAVYDPGGEENGGCCNGNGEGALGGGYGRSEGGGQNRTTANDFISYETKPRFTLGDQSGRYMMTSGYFVGPIDIGESCSGGGRPKGISDALDVVRRCVGKCGAQLRGFPWPSGNYTKCINEKVLPHLKIKCWPFPETGRKVSEGCCLPAFVEKGKDPNKPVCCDRATAAIACRDNTILLCWQFFQESGSTQYPRAWPIGHWCFKVHTLLHELLHLCGVKHEAFNDPDKIASSTLERCKRSGEWTLQKCDFWAQ